MSSPFGSLVTEKLGFDGGRQVTAYVPAVPPQAVVYAADGRLTAPWGRVLEADGLVPVLVIGTHRVDDEVVRIRHPDVYGTVLCASPGGGYRPPATPAPPLPRAYFVAGRQELFFRENAARWAKALHDAGADVTMTVRDGKHGDPFWREEFPKMISWAFT